MSKKNQNITLEVEGMTCTNCALAINKALVKKGLSDVDVNFSTGEVRFELPEGKPNVEKDAISTINNLGYKVIDKAIGHHHKEGPLTVEKKFYFSLFFTIPLFFSHMLLSHEHLLNQPLIQLSICIPVFIMGWLHFGKSAWGSLRAGIPNMDVLIVIGTSAAFLYSIAGTIQFYGTHEVYQYIFYETAATIISLVLLGSVMEHRSVKQTTTAIKELTKMQVTNAKKIVNVSGKEHIQKVKFSDIVLGDILMVNTGDKVPVDGEVIWGNAAIDESMISGESMPVEKSLKSKVIGGTILMQGNIKMIAEKVGKDTVLSQIIELVKNAQQKKPEIQKLGDKVSAVFVPIVVLIALSTFLAWHFIFDATFQQAMMNSIAVLVISCPCAMGLATPTAVMVGIGRAAKNGILIKGGNTLEELAKIKTVVFDKTGTITTGDFKIKRIVNLGEIPEAEIKNLLFSIEQHSSHPIAKSIVKELKAEANAIILKGISEEKGLGLKATDEMGNTYFVGSYSSVKHLTTENAHNIYLLKNGKLIAAVDIEDEIKTDAKELMHFLNSENITTVLLSGDKKEKCNEVASTLNMDKFYCEQLPHQKLELIDELVKQAPTAMIGDGINDAPALAKATVGISLSNATQVAIQSAQIILLKKNNLSQVSYAIQLSRHSLLTIKQNLFWAFFYNVIAIPIAAMGFLNPMIGALAMAFSDVIVVGNSIRLKTKKIF